MTALGTRLSSLQPLAGVLATVVSGGHTPSVNGPVQFNTSNASFGSGITLDTSTNVGRFTLDADSNYLIVASIKSTFVSGSGPISFQVRNLTDSAFLGVRSYHYSFNNTATDSAQPFVMAIMNTTGGSHTMEIWLQSITGTGGNAVEDDSWCLVLKL